MNEECGILRFCKRVLYKLSGQKIISTLVASMLIFLFVWARHRWAAHLTDEIVKVAIEAVKVLCLALLGANTALSVTDILKGKAPNGGA